MKQASYIICAGLLLLSVYFTVAEPPTPPVIPVLASHPLLHKAVNVSWNRPHAWADYVVTDIQDGLIGLQPIGDDPPWLYTVWYPVADVNSIRLRQ